MSGSGQLKLAVANFCQLGSAVNVNLRAASIQKIYLPGIQSVIRGNHFQALFLHGFGSTQLHPVKQGRLTATEKDRTLGL